MIRKPRIRLPHWNQEKKMKYIFFVIFNLTVAVSDNSREYRESYTRSELFDLKWPNRYMHLVDGDFIMEVRSTCIQFWKTSPERFLCIHSTNHSRTRWLGSGATCYKMTGFWGSFFWILPTCRISSRYLYFASFLVEGRCSIVLKLYDLSSMMGR